MAINKQNNSHTTPLNTCIVFIMPFLKGVGSRHRSGTGNNQGRKQTAPRDNQCFNFKDSRSKRNEFSSPVIPVPHPLNDSDINPPQMSSFSQQSSRSSQNTPRDILCFNCKDIHSKSNEFSSLVIPVPPPLNDSVINSPQLSLVSQQSSRSSQNTPSDNWCFNCKASHSKINYLSSPVIPVPPPFNDSVNNPPLMYSVSQQSYISSQNTTPESQAYSIPGGTSSDPSNTIPPPPTKNGGRNIYGCMVDVSKFTLA